jgi:tetratricopeptide (TPR) repeat protein
MGIALVVIVALGLLALLYFLYAPGPVRGRVLSRARALLKAGNGQAALALVQPYVEQTPPAAWHGPFRHLASECHRLGIEDALQIHDYDAAKAHALRVAELLGQSEDEPLQRVVEAALAEVRRRFATRTEAVEPMLARVEALTPRVPPEVGFWRALLRVREGDLEAAVGLLAQVNLQTGREYLDPPLYLGLILHRLGQPNEALKWLSEANRVDGTCPLVAWQIGVTLMACEGDSSIALRALQKSMGPRGLPQWQQEPGKLWIEGFPEGRSFIRRLAMKNGDVRGVTFPCPVLGSELPVLLRQGNLALAQALYRQDRFAESAELYGALLQNAPPTPLVLRGYGLALARSGQYDAAFKQLRLAFDQEDPKDPFTTGYMALSAARGTPTREGDKARNITWALKLLSRYVVYENREWATLLSQVHAEARAHQVPLSLQEQELLCDALASVQADDATAAAAYAHLAENYPDAIKPIYAWLYTHAATEQGVRSPVDLELFARTFQDSAKARQFFEQQKWDLSASEYVYLERAAQQAPGRFPDALGSHYPPQGTALLLARSQAEEKAGRAEPARQAMEVLLKLSPGSLPAYDRLACLYYRAGDISRAVDLLAQWRQLAPRDHWPLVRQAVIEQERGESAQRVRAIQEALSLTQGPLRASIAYLGAHLALRDALRRLPATAAGLLPEWTPEVEAEFQPVVGLLEECLAQQPTHADALMVLAALFTLRRDPAALAALAPRMQRPELSDARFHYLASVCLLHAGQYAEAIEAANRATRAANWANEAQLVAAWADAKRGAIDEALQRLETITAHPDAMPSRGIAHALAGHLYDQQQNYNAVLRHWKAIDPACRARWGLEEPLRRMVFLGGLAALQQGNYEEAAEQFREAGKLGLRERRLGGLITLALVKAGQKLLYETSGA